MHASKKTQELVKKPIIMPPLPTLISSLTMKILTMTMTMMPLLPLFPGKHLQSQQSTPLKCSKSQECTTEHIHNDVNHRCSSHPAECQSKQTSSIEVALSREQRVKSSLTQTTLLASPQQVTHQCQERSEIHVDHCHEVVHGHGKRSDPPPAQSCKRRCSS